MSLATLARSSLKQFSIILAEVRAEHGDVSGDQLETLMWEKIVGGNAEGTRIPSSLLKKLKHQLPYMPDHINYVGCCALKPTGGLYLPCGSKLADGSQYCAVCAKHEAKFGTLADRGKPGMYTDPSDKHEISYGTWLAKNEITLEEVYADLHEQGFTLRIPEEHLTVNSKRVAAPKRRPGRPGAVKKTKVNEDGTESPMGTSMDGLDHAVVLKSDEISDISDDEEGAEKIKKKVARRKMTAEEKAEKEAAKAAEKAEKEAAKEAAKLAKEAAKEKPKEKKTEKKTEKKAEKKASSDEESESEKKSEKKSEKPKEKKTNEKKTNEKKPKEKKTNEKKKAGSDLDEEHAEDEEVCIDGVEYIMRGKQLFDENGTLRGAIVNGKAELIE